MNASPWVGPPSLPTAVMGALGEGLPVLLAGPDGVGKRKLAREVATEVGKVLELRTSGPGATASVKDVLDSLSVRAAGHRVVVGALSPGTHANILNRLLKVLEEPPARVGFILTSSHQVLPTIASRCVRLGAPTMPSAMLAATLLSLTDDELAAAGVSGLDQDRAWWAAKSAQGRVGAGLELLAAWEGLPRAKALLRAAVEADKPSWLAGLAGLASAHEEAVRERVASEGVAVVRLLRTWAGEVLSYGGSTLLEDTFGLERDLKAVTDLWECLSAPAAVRYPALAVRRGLWSRVYG